jgi:26S proteasome regulatory subunit N1
LLARQLVNVEVEDESLNEILSNAKLSSQYIGLARELDVLEPKTPEDIYKSHLENTRMYI